MSQTLRHFHVWGYPPYVLGPKLQNPVLNIPKWYSRSQIGVNMVLSNINPTQVGLVLKFLNG